VTLSDLNALDDDVAVGALLRCCGSSRWARQMAAARPFANESALMAAADEIWSAADPEDWLEAFTAHPEIGGGPAAQGPAAHWSDREQAGVAGAAEETRRRLAEANREYRSRFGYIFIICATGRTGDEMLAQLEARLRHDAGDELRVAAGEQRKITQLRLAKLLEEEPDRR
jgi:OHCU decarboxylase